MYYSNCVKTVSKHIQIYRDICNCEVYIRFNFSIEKQNKVSSRLQFSIKNTKKKHHKKNGEKNVHNCGAQGKLVHDLKKLKKNLKTLIIYDFVKKLQYIH